jgi:salicylate hydroxylase
LYPFDAEADTREKWPAVSEMVRKELETGKLTPLFDLEKGPEKVLVEHDAFGRRKDAPLPAEVLVG